MWHFKSLKKVEVNYKLLRKLACTCPASTHVINGEANFQRLASKFSQINHLKLNSSLTLSMGLQMCNDSVCICYSAIFFPPYPSFATVPASRYIRKGILTMSPQIMPPKSNQNSIVRRLIIYKKCCFVQRPSLIFMKV